MIPGTPRFPADLDAIAAYYPVAAEGVIEPDGPYAWRFRTTQEYRGPRQGVYRITLISDCSLDPDAMNALIGKNIFALLVEGPGDHKGNFELGRCVNLQGVAVEKVLRERVRAACPKQ